MAGKSLNEIYDFLSKKYEDWYCSASKAQKAQIEQLVYDFMDNIDGALYAELNEGLGSGLCGSQFFKDDILRCLSILEDKLQIQH